MSDYFFEKFSVGFLGNFWKTRKSTEHIGKIILDSEFCEKQNFRKVVGRFSVNILMFSFLPLNKLFINWIARALK